MRVALYKAERYRYWLAEPYDDADEIISVPNELANEYFETELAFAKACQKLDDFLKEREKI